LATVVVAVVEEEQNTLEVMLKWGGGTARAFLPAGEKSEE